MNSLGVTLLGLMPIFNVNMSDPKAASFTSDIVKPIFKELSLHYKPGMIVNLPGLGRIRGRKEYMSPYSFNNTDMGIEYLELGKDIYDAFYGVPYAEPPFGDLRFANPVPVKPWKITLHNTRSMIETCVFKNYRYAAEEVKGGENCLYLTIFRPHNSYRRLPVMVYIHGGDFSTVPSNFMNPESFMITSRVVLVYISFRVGPFGFLSTNDKFMPGNFGLKDQRLALQFIKENIEHFGGDSNRITIFGHDTGAVSCHLHTMNPISTRYFDQAIIMSGNAIAPAYTRPVKDHLRQAQQILIRSGQYGAHLNNSQQIVSALRKMAARDVVQNAYSYSEDSVLPHASRIDYRYVIEKDGSDDSFLRRDPIDSLTEESSKAMPLMFSFVSAEGLSKVEEFHSWIYLLWTNEFPAISYPEFRKLTGLSKHILNKAYKYYVYEPMNATQLAKQIVKMFSDFEYLHPLYKTIESLFSKQTGNKQPVFVLKISYETHRDIRHDDNPHPNFGISHNEDMNLIFSDGRIYVDDFRGPVIRAYIEELVNFAEQKFNQLQECEKEKFLHANETNAQICQYKELLGTHDKPGFEAKIASSFDVEAMNLWSKILNEHIDKNK